MEWATTRYIQRVKRTVSSGQEARRRVDRLRALRGDATALRQEAIEIVASEGHPDILRLALEALGGGVRAEDGPALRALYEDFASANGKRDPGGAVRVEVLRVLWHLRSREDIELALRARHTTEGGLQLNGQMVRAAGLALLGVLDPERAAIEALMVLGRDANDPRRGHDALSGEPALTAVRLLGNLGQTNALLLVVLARLTPPGDILGEALRGLVPLGATVLGPILEDEAASGDAAVMLAAFDVALALPAGEEGARVVRMLFAAPVEPEVYAYGAAALVASRRSDLLEVFLGPLPTELSQARLRAAREALELAAPGPAVSEAIGNLDRRLQGPAGTAGRAGD